MELKIRSDHKYSKPQLATFIKLSEEHVLFLFSSKNDGLQRRFQIPFERVKNFTFKSLNDGYQQDGLQVVPKDLSGMEFEVSTYGEVVGEKRKGVNAPIWCFDQTNRGRQGDQGAKGRQGESGKDTQFGIRAGSLRFQLLEKGKRLVSSKADYESALKDGTGWILPMNTSLIKSWSKS